MKASVRAETTIIYHGRRGKPVLHFTKAPAFRPYVMVRAKTGGTKRLYLDTQKARQAITKGYLPLRKEANSRSLQRQMHHETQLQKKRRW